MEKFDLIVIGSGPAGSAAAITASSLGLKVAIIDKDIFPRNKLCGGLISGRSAQSIKSIFGIELSNTIFLLSNHLRFTASGEVIADIKGTQNVYLTMRKEFDALLHNRAVDQGAIAYLGDTVTKIQNNIITTRNGKALQFKTLIGADGVNSFVARHLFGKPFNRKTVGFGLEIETAPQQTRDNAVEIDLDAANWGYGWSFPKNKSITIGVAGISRHNSDIKARMSDFVKLTKSDVTLKFKGQYLPWGDFKKRPGKKNILLVGDAAGLVDPISGEGIALAMESGSCAAHAIYKALEQENPNKAISIYVKAIKPIHSSLRQARFLRIFIFHERMFGPFKNTFKNSIFLQNSFLKVIAGDLDYHDILLAFIRRIPRLGWRLIKHNTGFDK